MDSESFKLKYNEYSLYDPKFSVRRTEVTGIKNPFSLLPSFLSSFSSFLLPPFFLSPGPTNGRHRVDGCPTESLSKTLQQLCPSLGQGTPAQVVDVTPSQEPLRLTLLSLDSIYLAPRVDRVGGVLSSTLVGFEGVGS